MGRVNASPESFSDAGRFRSLETQRELCAGLVEAGADIIDIGGQSAITNRPELDAAEELDRVLPLVEWVHANLPDVLISVDTYKPPVVEGVLQAGAGIINDVSGLRYPEIVEMCARRGAGLVVTHTRARPKQRLQEKDLYEDVVADVCAFLRDRVDTALARGLDSTSIILDPGPDFSKTPSQTVEVLRSVEQLRGFGRPLLLALSRKDFLGAVTGRSSRGRDAATHAATAYFASTPGSIMRVHDVAAARDVVATVEVLAGLREI
jgi:dihydropteroate synthase